MIVTLPWPPKELSVNSRVHFRERAKHTKVYRESAYWLTRKAFVASLPDTILIAITWHPPDRRRYDLDGLLSRSKCQIDGFSDAIERNDYDFAFQIRRGDPVPNGSVVFEVKVDKEGEIFSLR